MANPSIKNGYIPIANELAEKLASINIPGNEMRIIWVVLRKTWGWKMGDRKKDWDWISGSQFEKLTGIQRRNCIDCIKSLVSKNILLREENRYRFNQDYDQWAVSKRTQSVQKQTKGVSKSIQKAVSKSIHTKETLKDNIQKIGETPAQTARGFFKGVDDLRNGVDSDESKATKVFLQTIETKYSGVDKRFLWNEIQRFERYWTEKTKSGKKEKWETNETFEVDRRLVTWFGNIKVFENNKNKINNKYKVGIVQKK